MPKAKPESITARLEKLKADVAELAKRLANPPVIAPPTENRDVAELRRRVDNLVNQPQIGRVMPTPEHHLAIWGAIAILTVCMVALVSWQTLHVNEAINPSPSATVSTPPAAPVVEPAIKSEPLPSEGNLVRTGGIVLQLTVNRECWYEGESDGQKIPGRTWPSGATRNIGAVHEISIKSGCPGGINYEVNGKETSPVNLSNNPKIELVKFESELASR